MKFIREHVNLAERKYQYLPFKSLVSDDLLRNALICKTIERVHVNTTALLFLINSNKNIIRILVLFNVNFMKKFTSLILNIIGALYIA